MVLGVDLCASEVCYCDRAACRHHRHRKNREKVEAHQGVTIGRRRPYGTVGPYLSNCIAHMWTICLLPATVTSILVVSLTTLRAEFDGHASALARTSAMRVELVASETSQPVRVR